MTQSCFCLFLSKMIKNGKLSGLFFCLCYQFETQDGDKGSFKPEVFNW